MVKRSIVEGDYIPHQIHLSKPQINKLGKGLATNLNHSQMGADKGDIVIMLRPQNAKKMLPSLEQTGWFSFRPHWLQATYLHLHPRFSTST